MNGSEKEIYDRIERLDMRNRQEHKEILDKLDEWHKVCLNRQPLCYQAFVKGSTFWKVIVGMSAAWAAVISYFHLRG